MNLSRSHRGSWEAIGFSAKITNTGSWQVFLTALLAGGSKAAGEKWGSARPRLWTWDSVSKSAQGPYHPNLLPLLRWGQSQAIFTLSALLYKSGWGEGANGGSCQGKPAHKSPRTAQL